MGHALHKTGVAVLFLVMAAFCYILYSKSIDRFYIGSTGDTLENRLIKHNSKFYDIKIFSLVNEISLHLSIIDINF